MSPGPPESDSGQPPPLHRLDPDQALPERGGSEAERPAYRPVTVDPRPYRWMVGIIGLTVILGVGAYQFISHGTRSSGVPPGQRLHLFAAPLATSTLNGDPNPHPTCSPSHHDPRALNLCLLAARGPVVVSFFTAGAASCQRQVSALQTLSTRFPTVQFVAVAVNAGHAATAGVVTRHGWTIPVAYDRDGTIQQLYDVVACPMVQMAGRGGIVRSRLIGDRWQTAASLVPYVRGLLAGGR